MSSLTGQINSYWASNSFLTSIIPSSSFYVEITPEGTQLPLAVLSSNSVTPSYTTGDPYLLEYKFTITLWSYSLAQTQTYADVVRSQFVNKNVVPNCGGCLEEHSNIIVEETDEATRYIYAQAISFVLWKTMSHFTQNLNA